MTTVTLDHVSKSFGPVRVIEDVSITLNPGEVHVLLGENGAGKSTLIKMIAGIHKPDAGRILVNGEEVTLSGPRAASALGIATIHQELNLVPSLSIAENIALGAFPARAGVVNRRVMRLQAQESLELVGLPLDVDLPVGHLGIAQQQLVEIAKALSMHSRALILDEPTAALTGKEITQLFAIMHQLKARGVAMVFISHHLDEIPLVGDLVSILRDGHLIAQVPPSTSERELVKHMVGRPINEQFPARAAKPGDILLDVDRLTTSGSFADVSVRVHAGEVVGLAGLVGAGRTELIRAIAGADTHDSGSVSVAGITLPPGNVAAAIRAGIGHVPENRKTQGLVLGAPIWTNLGLATLFSTAKAGLADHKGQRERARRVAERLRIRMRDADQRVRDLSGGNQQKVVFGRWTLAGSRVLLLDEPTRGVDVGAKVEIYELINAVVEGGGAVLMASSELPEVLGMADRIVVMSGGRIAGELSASEATQDSVMTLAVKNVDTAEVCP